MDQIGLLDQERALESSSARLPIDDWPSSKKLANAGHAVPPLPLWIQFNNALRAANISPREAVRMAGLSYDEIYDVLIGGRGTISVFLKVIELIEHQLAITTWQGRLLVPLEDATDAGRLCRALTEYKHYCWETHFRIWPPVKMRMMIECGYPDATVVALGRYLEPIHAHGCIIGPFGHVQC